MERMEHYELLAEDGVDGIFLGEEKLRDINIRGIFLL